MEVFEYLRGWELPELIPIFEEQQIDADAFENLTNEDIKELIPLLGPRKKFLQKYNEFKSVQEALLHPTLIENSVKDDQCSGKSDVSIETRYDSDSTITYQSDTSQSTSVSDSLEKNLAPIIYYSEKATVGEPYDIREIPSNGVLQLLQNSDEGKIVMSSYKKNKCFLRNELARIIIKNELKKSQDKKISSARFQELAKEVNDIFLHESPDIYYIPYARTPGGKPITAKGKLWSAYVNLRRNFRRCGLLDNKDSDTEAESSNITDTNKYHNLEEKFLWLKNNIEPTSEVTENWKITFSQRMNEKDNTIEQYYRKFPCLSQPLGYLLLQNDFDQMYPGREHSLFVKYPQMAAKIYKILQERKDSFINEKLQIFQETHLEPTEDEINLLTLTLLPLLVPTPMRKKIGCNWKPTKIELLDGFMLFVNNAADVQPALDRRAAKYSALKLTAQPIPCVVGTDELSAYVSVNKTLYKVENPLKAVDLCFKIFHALNATYPYEAESAWMFLQTGIYNIKTKYDKHFSSVNTLLADIRKEKHLYVHESTTDVLEMQQNTIPNNNHSVEMGHSVSSKPQQSRDSSNSNQDLSEDLIKKIENDLTTQFTNFSMDMYDNSLIPRKFIQFIINYNKNIFIDIFSSLKTILNSENLDMNLFLKLLDVYMNCWKKFDSEYKCLECFKKSGYFIPPNEYVIGQRNVDKPNSSRIVEICNIPVIAKYVPLRHVLKCLFQNHEVLYALREYSLELEKETSTISNFSQSDLWKMKIKNYENKKVYPLFLFFDDYETGNPLGSHAGINKLGAVYISLPSMPPKLVSKLNNIFLFALFYSDDRKIFGNKAVFSKLVEELKYLQETGITINNADNKSETIFFKLGLINGDNLGLHTILGFTESFSANFCCRFCTMHKNDRKMAILENETFLRSFTSYETDVIINNVSLTGIKEYSIWNDLPGFHVTSNYSVDIMHDLLEGVCVYDLTNLLQKLINDYKLFSLETLNSRIQYFSYCESERSNKPPLVTFENLKTRLKMSASEMLCFTRYLGLLIGDLIPFGLPLWDIWIKLREIIALTTSPIVHRNDFQRLQAIIEEHHFLYIKYFGELKPKHHHLLHYHRVLQMCGPLLHLWSMRSEQKHRQSKMTSNVSCNFRSIIHTLAIKSQLKVCKNLNNINCTRDIKHGPISPLCVSEHSQYFLDFQDSSVVSIKWLNYSESVYKVGYVLMLDHEHEEPFPSFGHIEKIFLFKNTEVYILFNVMTTIAFSTHHFAFEVEKNEYNKLFKIENIVGNVPCQVNSISGKLLISTRYE